MNLDLKKQRGRKPIIHSDQDKILKQEKQRQYYKQFRLKHEENGTLPTYYKKPGAIKGRPPKQKLEPVQESNDPGVTVINLLDDVINKLSELKSKINI